MYALMIIAGVVITSVFLAFVDIKSRGILWFYLAAIAVIIVACYLYDDIDDERIRNETRDKILNDTRDKWKYKSEAER